MEDEFERTWRAHFPAVAEAGAPGEAYVYLDSAATTHRPQQVIDAITNYYRTDNANPRAALHAPARRSHAAYERARARVARFLGADDPLEVVWVRGTSEAINLVATAWGAANVRAGDEIVLTVAEHYSNLVPWQLLAGRTGAVLRFLDVDDAGVLRLDQLDGLLSRRTKLVAVSHASNVLGALNPVREIADRAHAVGARVLVDGAQSVAHVSVDVRALGCDFFALSGHKILGPMGIGALWARRELLESMPPYHGGGDMARDVTLAEPRFASGAHKFEAGSPNVAGAIGMEAALDFLDTVGYGAIGAHERRLSDRLLAGMTQIPGIRVLGAAAVDRLPIVSFAADLDAASLVTGLDAKGFAIRGGELSARPLLERFGLQRAARVSLSLYNTAAEVDRFIGALEEMARAQRSCVP